MQDTRGRRKEEKLVEEGVPEKAAEMIVEASKYVAHAQEKSMLDRVIEDLQRGGGEEAVGLTERLYATYGYRYSELVGFLYREVMEDTEEVKHKKKAVLSHLRAALNGAVDRKTGDIIEEEVKGVPFEDIQFPVPEDPPETYFPLVTGCMDCGKDFGIEKDEWKEGVATCKWCGTKKEVYTDE